MPDDCEALREVNERFYLALETVDIEAMDRLWCHDGWVRCVHPGWDVVAGWGAVRRSWERIFSETRWIRVVPTAVEVDVFGDVAVVACSENITEIHEGDVEMVIAQATNLYRRTPEGWRMIHHHASPAPLTVTQPGSGRAQ